MGKVSGSAIPFFLLRQKLFGCRLARGSFNFSFVVVQFILIFLFSMNLTLTLSLMREIE